MADRKEILKFRKFWSIYLFSVELRFIQVYSLRFVIEIEKKEKRNVEEKKYSFPIGLFIRKLYGIKIGIE